MESIKNREKQNKKLLLCFRPVAMDDGSVKPDRTDGPGDPVFKYIAVGNNKESNSLMIPTILSSLSDERLKVSDEEVVVAGRRPKKAKFSRILKAVLFETSLAKKIRNRKARKSSYRSNSNLLTKDDKFSNSLDEKSMARESSEEDDRRLNSNASSSLHPSSLTASSSLGSSRSLSRALNSRSLSERKTSFLSNSIELKQRHDRCNYGLCLLLISLLVLIFWGRICAIFCTSTWLFFVPRRSIGHGSPGNGVGSPEIESVEYKKRIIMEGLLERNRTRVLLRNCK